MDQGLKERLIGAAVLVLIGVLVIPWILDGRGSQQETSATALRLPAPDEPVPVRTETIQVGRSPDAAAEPTPAATPPAEQQVATADLTRDADEPPAAVAAASLPPAAPAVPTATPSRIVADVPAASAPSRSPPPPVPTPTKAATAKGTWTVQLGSFGDDDNAKKLAQRVSTFGYKPAVSAHKSSGGRVLYRVRVGPYEKRSEAGATASSLSAHGFVAQVVAAD
jgi:DedD protein